MNASFQVFIRETRDGYDWEVLSGEGMTANGSTQNGPMEATELAHLFLKGVVAGLWEAQSEKIAPR